jgi:hypothetical protein
MNKAAFRTQVSATPCLTVTENSPGDGVTRYKFHYDPNKKINNYFQEEGLFVALGLKEARAFLKGYIAGYKN